jgi:hypothetical protein
MRVLNAIRSYNLNPYAAPRLPDTVKIIESHLNMRFHIKNTSTPVKNINNRAIKKDRHEPILFYG